MKDRFPRIDTLIADAAAGRLSRREVIKRASALGLGVPFAAALINAAAVSPAAAQEVTLNFDAASTAGGGGKPNAAATEYCYVLNGGSQFEFNRMVDARLITLSADLQGFVGDLAESWEIADTTATFTLRQNAKWHDGTPVTAKDILFTINTLTDPATTSRWGAAFRNVVGYAEAQTGATPTSLTGLTAPDDYTVQITLTQPDSGLLAGFFFINIMPEHILGTVDRTKIAEQAFWTEGRIGAGPFKFIKLVEGERIELEANADYHHGAPAISKLNLLFFESTDTSLAAFQAGESLISPMSVAELELVQGIEGAEIVTTPAGVAAIWINNNLPEFSDKRARQAIAYAIDKKTITETIWQGYADPVSTEIPYVTWAQPADANPYDFDPEKAKSLLAEVGWDSSKSFTLWYYYGDQITAAVMEAMQQYLGAVGINVELQFDDGSGVRTKQVEDGTWALTYGSFGAQPAPSNLTAVWGPPGKKNFTYSSAEFDAAMDAALHTYDQAEQATYYQQAVKILNEDSPWVWLFNRKNLIAVHSDKLTTGSTTAFGPGHIMYHNHAFDWTVSG